MKCRIVSHIVKDLFVKCLSLLDLYGCAMLIHCNSIEYDLFFVLFFLDIDECASTPCMYGNDCIQDRINSYICVCSERYEGVQCERGKTHYNNRLCLPSNPI